MARYRQRIHPKPEDGKASYLGSCNVDIIDGKVVPAFDHGRVSGEVDFCHYVVATIEYRAPTTGNPRHYIFVNKSAYRWEDGALTLDGSFTDVVQGAAMVDNGSGTPIIMATFGDSATVSGHYYRTLTTDTTPWTLNTGATYATAFQLCTNGPDVYLVTGTASVGRTLLGEHKVAKIPPGLDPRLVASYAAAEPVGITADWPITGLVPLRDSVVANRGDGPYVRNDTSKMWEPIRPLMSKLPHGLNGKGMSAGENGVWIPTNAGEVALYDGVNVSIQSPYHRDPIAKDALKGRISAIADLGPRVVMHEEPCHTYLDAAQAGLAGVRFFTVINGVEAEITSGLTDGSLITPAAANFNAWGAHAADKFYVVSPFRLEGLVPIVTRNPNAAANRFTTPECSNGSAGWTSLGNVIDFTRLSTSTISLALTGFPAAATEAVLRWDALNAFDLAQKDSITLATIAMSNVYIYRFSPSTTTAMTVTTTMDACGVIEARQGLPVADGDATKDFTHLERAGCLSKLHVGERIGVNQFRWHTVYVLDTHGGVQGLSWTTAKSGTLSNGGYSLLVLARERQFQIAEGVLRDPTRTSRARLTQWTTTEVGPMLAMRNIDFREGEGGQYADPTKPRRIVQYDIPGIDNVQPDDVLRMIVELDNGRAATEYNAGGGSPRILRNSDAGKCRKADHFLCIEDTNQSDPFAPQITEIWMEWEYADGEFPVDPPFETPAVA